MRIYWASRHNPLPVQIRWLENRFGQEIEVVMGRSDNADLMVDDFYAEGCDEMVIVAPLWVIYHVLQKGIKPLYAEMEETTPDRADLQYRGRFYKFNKFTRIADIKIIKEEV